MTSSTEEKLTICRMVHVPIPQYNEIDKGAPKCHPAVVWAVMPQEYVKVQTFPVGVDGGRSSNEGAHLPLPHDPTKTAPVPSWHWPHECKPKKKKEEVVAEEVKA